LTEQQNGHHCLNSIGAPLQPQSSSARFAARLVSILGANSAGSMSATDLASSHFSSEWADTDSYEPAASTFGSKYKRLARSKSSVSAVDSHSSSTLKVVKLEVKAPTAGRSGLLAAQLKGYAGRLLSSYLVVAVAALALPKLPSAGHLHRQVLPHCQLASTPLLAESAMEN